MDTVNRRGVLRTAACAVSVTAASGCLSEGNENDDDPEMRLESSVDEIQLPRAEFELTVTNEGPGETPFVVGAHRVGVAKVVGGEPKYVSPLYRYKDNIGGNMPEGETLTLEVEVDNKDSEMVDADLATSLGGVGPGTYRFGQLVEDGLLDEGTNGIEVSEPTTEVEFVGQGLDSALEPPPGLEENVERDGDVVTVSPSEGKGMLVIKRVEGEAPELILEQVLQSTLLWGVVGLFDEGTEEVRWGENGERLLGHVRTAYGIDDKFEYDGEVYEIRIE